MALPKIREQIEARVKDTGDTMTGLLTLSGNPTADFHAATKKYVDDNTSDVANTALKLTTNAGSSTLPVYFADGIPKQCSTSLGVSITGNAATATKATQDGNGATITSTYVPFTSQYAAGVDFNKIINSGFHRVSNGNLNNPGSDWGQLLVMHGGGDTITQIYGAYDGTLKTRGGNPADVGGTGSWTEWKTLLDSSNYTSYTVTKTGSGASGTWGISISGSAGSVSWSNISGKPNLDRAPIVYTINLSSYSTSNFYFVDFGTSNLELDCEIHSRGASAADPWNQNVLHFLMVGEGWSDTPKNLTILNQSFYDGSEKTIMSIVHGNQNGVRGVYLRGGLTYTIKSNFVPNLNTTTKTAGNESYASGTTSYTTITNATTLWTNDGVSQSIFSMPVNAVMLSNTDYTTYRGRSIAANTSALTSGSSSLSNGYIYVQYE